MNQHHAKPGMGDAALQSQETALNREPKPYRAPLPAVIAHELPSLYNETYLRVIPRDPFSLFSFWETSGSAFETAGKKMPAPADPPLLRLYETDTGAGEKPASDFFVKKGERSRYLPVPRPGRRYRLEYGMAVRDRFIPLCASNEVAVPPARVLENERKNTEGGLPDTDALIGFSMLSPASAASAVSRGHAPSDLPAGYPLSCTAGAVAGT